MLKEKGHIKVYNGKKYKYVSYLKDGNKYFFTTSSKSNKYSEFKKSNILTIKMGQVSVIADINIIEDTATVDKMFNILKEKRAIPFFIPRNNKVIVEFTLKDC